MKFFFPSVFGHEGLGTWWLWAPTGKAAFLRESFLCCPPIFPEHCLALLYPASPVYGAFTWNSRRVRLILGGDALCILRFTVLLCRKFLRALRRSTCALTMVLSGLSTRNRQQDFFRRRWLPTLFELPPKSTASRYRILLQVTSMANIHNHADSQAWTKPWDSVAPRRAAARQPCG